MIGLLLACLLAAPPAGSAGRLVVVVVIDQLRYSDVLMAGEAVGKDGFAGLGRPVPMRYRTVGTETATNHATLATGAYAMVHGVVANEVFEDGARRAVVDDPKCPVWGSKRGRSATRMVAPTFGDALKLASAGRARVVSVSGKDRAALMLAGQSADLALWIEPGESGLVSSTCYASAPPPWLLELSRQHPATAWAKWVWTPSRPMDALVRLGALPPSGPARHTMAELQGKDTLEDAVRATPPGVTLTLRAADAAARSLRLGELDHPDLLLISLSSLDYAGHLFGTFSWERADQLLRIHDELVAFLSGLDRRLGRGRVSVLLASDHGVTAAPEDAGRLRVPAGRVREADLREAVERALAAAYPRAQPRRWVADVDAPFVRLSPPSDLDRAEVARRAARAAESVPGVAEAVAFPEVLREPDTSPVRRAFFPGRSGDVIVVPRPGWVFTGGVVIATTHRSPWSDDALVPFMFRDGRFRIRPELQAGFEATRFAPSAAAILGIGPPGAALEDAAIIPASRKGLE
ncbi:MAG TPA: alkaline phosphatase family protein [Myxococcales bacterium]|nr:alkaline phosphatase family protein [Myxococcales bacterium]